MSSAWRCDSCEANNEAGATECRICHQVPGSATGAARQVADAFVQTRQPEPAPEYTESRHGQYRPPRMPVHPPMPIGGTPPRPPVAPIPRPVARPKRGIGGMVFGLVGVAAVAVVIIAAALNTHQEVAGGQSSSDTGVPAASSESSAPPEPSGPPCPDAAATYLADGGADSVLVVEYDSPRYTITLCEADDGRLYYDGQLKDAAPSDTTHISIPAEQSTSGYTASNNGYTYDIGSTEEQLTHAGRVIEEFPLTRTGP